MVELFAEAALPSATNPEALINAAIAAKAAELAANQSFYISIVIILMLLIIGALMMFVAYKFDELKRNTDGMRDQLVEATRKLALLEGNMIGRAEQTAEKKEKVDPEEENK